MAATISSGDWDLAVSRITALERQVGLEQQERGQLITALRQVFLTAQERWQACSAALEELRAHLGAIWAAASTMAVWPRSSTRATSTSRRPSTASRPIGAIGLRPS